MGMTGFYFVHDANKFKINITGIKIDDGQRRRDLIHGGKSPVGEYKRVEALQFFFFFFFFFMFAKKKNLIVSPRRDKMLTWLIFHLFGNLSDNN